MRSNTFKFLIALVAIFAIFVFYNFGRSPRISGMNDSYDNSLSHFKEKNAISDMNDILLSLSNSESETKPMGLHNNNKVVSDRPEQHIDVMITFTKADRNYNLQNKFRTTVKSLLKFSSIPVNLYILGDLQSKNIAKGILAEVADSHKYTLMHLNIDNLAKQVHEIVSEMQKYFSYAPGAYYSDSLFFISLVIHRVLPYMHRVIMLDCDLKFNADIKELYQRFEMFNDSNIMGIARDAQPVYRHNFHMYINKNKGTRVGAPPPDGLTGFNSGVMLLDLDRMRESKSYNSLLNAESVKEMTEKYLFKGHLGDQDFYSLISLEHEELFHVLPCNWNRQLCTWWRNHGYEAVFDEYYNCNGHINIYHGNCNTEIPKLDWET